MKRFVQGDNRTQSFLLPEALDDYVTDTNPVRVVDVFVDELDLPKLGFDGVEPALTGRPSYHPEVMLKIYIYGYLNRIQSSRRLEREAQRNIELMWLTGRLAPDFKTIARFRQDNGKAIRSVCRQFVMLCQRLDLFSEALVAIDGSKFKAVNHRDRNFTSAKLERRMRDIEASISRYLVQMDTADRQEPTIAKAKTERLQDKIAALKEQMQILKQVEVQLDAAPDKQVSLTDPDARSMKTRGTDAWSYPGYAQAFARASCRARCSPPCCAKYAMRRSAWSWLWMFSVFQPLGSGPPIRCSTSCRSPWKSKHRTGAGFVGT